MNTLVLLWVCLCAVAVILLIVDRWRVKTVRATAHRKARKEICGQPGGLLEKEQEAIHKWQASEKRVGELLNEINRLKGQGGGL